MLAACDHRSPIGRLVETRWLPPTHVTDRRRLPVTTLARTFFDLCGDPDPGLRVPRTRHHERQMTPRLQRLPSVAAA